MAKNIISSFPVFLERFGIPEQHERSVALRRYFERGGVVNAVKSESDWPRLIYPSPLRIDSQVKELEGLKAHYEAKRREWRDKLNSANSYHYRHQLLKFSEPLYWKHLAKSLADSEYRKDAESVVLPVHLSADPKWKPMINMFVNDLEYRKNLVETVRTSIVYKKERKVARYADVLQALRSEISTGKLEELGKRISKLEEEIEALRVIRKWAQGK